MFRNLRNTIVSLLSAATLLAVPMAVPAVALAADPANSSGATIQTCLAQGSNLDASTSDSTCSGSTDTNAGASNVNNIIKTVINIFSVVVGVVAVIMIIVGGFRYITSGGESSNISSAKNTIIYAIIGLVIVALAQFIVQFVLNKVTSS
ncbi:MAG TPA: TrbC/VirB2 family protein [Candidatus Saccharimonadales bacterium]|nr:TrbC/VirB2 family protein [Candidatus Saccharimonadales bacterium]